MSYDNTTNEWHLTLKGWVHGNYYYYSKLQGEDKTPPEDRVETWNKEMTQASGWSLEVIRWNCAWVSPDHSKEERDALRKKYGERPS